MSNKTNLRENTLNMNMSYQNTTGLDYKLSSWIESAKCLRLICVPIIIIVGVVGNTLALLVFRTQGMKRSSCSVFLAALAAADNAFLISLLVTYVNGTIYTILTTNVTCQLLIFITYVASFLSVWLIVGFTIERYIAIRFPLKRAILCSVGREKVIVVILTIIACSLYTFSFWTTEAVPIGEDIKCSYREEFFNFLNISTWIDTCITIVIPFLVIIVLNSLLVQRNLINNKKRAAYTQPRCGDRKAVLHPFLRVTSHRKNTDCTRRIKCSMLCSTNPQGRVTRTLLFVSLTFICLNLPSHAIRLYSLIGIEDYQTVSVDFLFFQELTMMLYYATFGCNIFIYTLFGRNFKRSLLLFLRCKSAMHAERKKVLEKLSSMHTLNTSSL